MAGTFQTRVQSYLGTGYSETATLSDNLTAGAKYIADLLPVDKLKKFVTDTTDTGTGVSVTGMRFLGAHKSYVNSIEIPKGLKSQASDSSSMYYATAASPVHYIDGGLAYVLPSGGSVTGYAYPTVLYTDTTVASFPNEFDHAVVLFAVVQGCLDLINDGRVALNALSYSNQTPPTPPADFALALTTVAPTAPVDSSYSYSNAVLGTYSATTIGLLGTVPSYTKPTIAMTATPADFTYSLSVVFPTAPSAPAYSYTDAVLGTYTATTIGLLGTAPTYTKPTITMTTAPADFAYSLAVVAPTSPSAPAYSSSDAVLGTYTATTIGSLGVAPTYTKPTTTFDVTTATTYIATNEDLERAQTEISKQGSLLEQYSKDITNELNEFNKEAEVYKSTVQNAIRQAELDQERLMLNASKTTDLSIQNKAQSLNAAISLYKDTLQKYVSDFDAYVKIINKEVTLYKVNLEKWQTQRQTELQQYSYDIQNEVNEYQKELEVYRSTVQNAIRQAELDQERLMLTASKTTDLSIQNKAQALNKDINLYKDVLQNYAEQLDGYTKIVEKEIQLYRVNFEKWQVDRQTQLGQYAQDIQNEANAYSKTLAIYQSTVQDAIRQAELDQERLMLAASKTTDLNLQNAAQTLNSSISLYKDKLQKFASQIDLFRAQVESEIQTYVQKMNKFQSQLQLYSSQIQEGTTKYGADQQKINEQINHFTVLLSGVRKEFEEYLKARI